jgi:lathosterol oxidase
MVLLLYVLAAIAGGLGLYLGVGGLFELVYYRRRRHRAAEWKLQPRRWLTPSLWRHQVLLGTFNTTCASIASGLLIYFVILPGHSALYFDHRAHSLLYTLISTVLYFLVTDCALYWAHRLFHRPAAFRRIHRWHHRYTCPSPLTAMAMHPLELTAYQTIMLAPIFLFPLHYAGVIAVLIYQNYVALVDHSGIDFQPWLPWQPPARFHDDHHVHFHVNYGQNMDLWDRIFGTYRRMGRIYGEHIFGGQGAPASGASDGLPALVDYRRRPAPARPAEGTASEPTA